MGKVRVRDEVKVTIIKKDDLKNKPNKK